MITVVLLMTRKHLAATSFKHQYSLLFQHSATPKNLTRKGNYRRIWGAASTVEQCCMLC